MIWSFFLLQKCPLLHYAHRLAIEHCMQSTEKIPQNRCQLRAKALQYQFIISWTAGTEKKLVMMVSAMPIHIIGSVASQFAF